MTRLSLCACTHHLPCHRSHGPQRFLLDFTQVVDLGRGSFGRVVRAEHKLDQQIYAVKILRLDDEEADVNNNTDTHCGRESVHSPLYKLPRPQPNPQANRRKLLREVTTLSRLHHPNIVRYYQAWIERCHHQPNEDEEELLHLDDEDEEEEEDGEQRGASAEHKSAELEDDNDLDA